MSDPRVSVIIPSFNRAGLLPRTIPAYLQPETAELLLVDDCSTDDTERAAAELAARDPRIRYIRSERNLKQTHAKNLGIAAARFSLVYFGDDDSVLLPGSLSRLVATMDELGADVVGARALYMESAEDEADFDAFSERQPELRGDLVAPLSLRTHFECRAGGPIEAAFVHAAFLTRRELAARLLFDEGYRGNCYREETDFLIRAKASGARIFFEPRAAQVNLPRSSSGGGAHGGASASFVRKKLRYFSDVLWNNARFLKKNRKALDIAFGRRYPAALRQACLAWDVFKAIASYPLRKLRHNG
jgi:glycosyltransferase involved in cell wall biosynthesis